MQQSQKIKSVAKGAAIYSALLLFLLAVNTAAQWVGPTTTPPGADAPPPVNVGTTDQIKEGSFGVMGVFRAYDNVYIDGRLGVGTQALYAGAMVTIEGDRMAMYNPSNGITYMTLSPSPSDPTKDWNIGADTAGSFYFATNMGIPAGAKLTIKNDGSVGIGTTNPQSRLHVVGDSASLPFAYFDNLIVMDDGAFGKNLLPNWQFESATHWENLNQASSVFSVVGGYSGPQVWTHRVPVPARNTCSPSRLMTTYIPIDPAKGYEATVWIKTDDSSSTVFTRWGAAFFDDQKNPVTDSKTTNDQSASPAPGLPAGFSQFKYSADTASWTKHSAYLLPYTSISGAGLAEGSCNTYQTTDKSRCFSGSTVKYVRLWYDACGSGSYVSGSANYTMPTFKEINPGQNYFSGAVISDKVHSDLFCDKTGATCLTFYQLGHPCADVQYSSKSGALRAGVGYGFVASPTFCPTGYEISSVYNTAMVEGSFSSPPFDGVIRCCKP
jgi:hypothetical protein